MSGLTALRRKVLGFGVFGTAGFAAVGRRVAPPADRALQRLSRGKLSLTEMGGLPFLILHTVGRRTGQPRATPLIYARMDDGYVVVGSNWGQAGQPGWALNLRAASTAEVEIRGRRRPVTARVLEGEERAAAWKLLLEFWPAYDDYAERSAGRELWVFLLTPGE